MVIMRTYYTLTSRIFVNLAPTTREINKEESIQGINLQSDRHWTIYA